MSFNHADQMVDLDVPHDAPPRTDKNLPIKNSPVIAVVGPTASGKSALADQLAVHFKSFVISADAMQVYRGMDIGTAKIPPQDHISPLMGVDVTDISQPFSAACFQKYARGLIDTKHDYGVADATPVILCGGTGLYIDAIIDCMEFPQGEQKENPIRTYYESLLEQSGHQRIFELLVQKDPESAHLIHPHNTRRVIRALEMAAQGISYSRQSHGLHLHKPYYPSVIIGLRCDREVLYERINKRVDDMVKQGLFEEVSSLCEAGLTDALTALQAIGYKEVLSFLKGEITQQEAIDLIKRNSRRYAKRQMTWFNRDRRVQWIDTTNLPAEYVLQQAIQRSEHHSC